jgi:hypothetical protein
MRTTLGRFVLNATASLGLASVSFLNAYAGDPHLSPVQPNCPYPIVPAPGAPATAAPLPGLTTPLPGATTAPTPGATTAIPDAGVGASIPADAGAVASTGGGDDGPSGGGTGTDMIGRSDFFNRFNLFDTQSAIPRNRVWFNFQRNEDFNPGLIPNTALPLTPTTIAAVHDRPTQYLYRGGVELALTPYLSFAAQQQYIAMTDTTFYNPSWGDPQFMLKCVVSQDHDRTVSAILGVSPHLSQSPGEIRSPRARIYPGFLFYRSLNEVLFTQGGAQFGLPLATRGDIVTFDYAFSTGFWLYRACETKSCRRPWLTGVAPQVEFFGQHAFWDSHVTNPPQGGATTVLQQGRHVVDVTLGTSIFFRNLLFGAGYSFPVTGAEARRGEIIGTLQYRF